MCFRRFTAAQSSLFSCAAQPSCALTWRCSSSRSSPFLEQQCPWILGSLLKVCYCQEYLSPVSDACFRRFQPSHQVQKRMGFLVRATTHDCTMSQERRNLKRLSAFPDFGRGVNHLRAIGKQI
ncbi:hypothetical protein H4582DRAFT_417038 [Lactarius indigo]|nr:hypothetical protein H4582DRAFT_417038 [Lactarius indigo]